MPEACVDGNMGGLAPRKKIREDHQTRKPSPAEHNKRSLSWVRGGLDECRGVRSQSLKNRELYYEQGTIK